MSTFCLKQVGVRVPPLPGGGGAYQRDSWINTLKLVNVSIKQAKRRTRVKGGLAALIE